jgi:tRNA (guanine10-N2)-methyltransferase
LFHFAHEHVDFRVPEISSIASSFGIDFVIPSDYDNRSPYLVVNLPTEESARQIMSRSVTAKSVFEVWAQDSIYSCLHQKLKALPSSLVDQYVKKSDASFRVRVECFNKQISLHDRIARVEQLLDGVLEFTGPMDLSDNCTNTFYLLEYYGPQGAPPPDEPHLIYFGRWICDGHRDAINKYQLQKRHFIGNTSMDPMLSLIMSNMAKVTRGSFVYDPFVGTGSLLIACAHFGAYVIGTDIDYKTLHAVGKSSRAGQKWRAKDETVYNNLCQYGLGQYYIDVLVADASLSKLWRSQLLFDAIVADPPYGVREPMKKLGSKKDKIKNVDDAYHASHIPSKTDYTMTDILADLLRFAANFLTVNGRLVYWLPVFRDEYKPENIPQHQCLQLIANTEQTLNQRVSRRLITMQKVKQPDEVDDAGIVHMEVNHYANMSFRERYFRPEYKPQHRHKMDEIQDNKK